MKYTPITNLETAMQMAVDRTKKTKRSISVFRLTDPAGNVRYRLYLHYQQGNVFKDMRVGESVLLLGYTNRHLNDPYQFWPQSHFKDEFDNLPANVAHETRIFGKPYKVWLAEQQDKKMMALEADGTSEYMVENIYGVQPGDDWLEVARLRDQLHDLFMYRLFVNIHRLPAPGRFIQLDWIQCERRIDLALYSLTPKGYKVLYGHTFP